MSVQENHTGAWLKPWAGPSECLLQQVWVGLSACIPTKFPGALVQATGDRVPSVEMPVEAPCVDRVASLSGPQTGCK